MNFKLKLFFVSVESGFDMLPPPPPPAYHDSRNFTLSPETTDCDSADLESELSVPSAGEGSYHSSGPRHTTMPILEVRNIKRFVPCWIFRSDKEQSLKAKSCYGGFI